MKSVKYLFLNLVISIATTCLMHSVAFGGMTDLNTWTQVQDPSHPQLTGTVDTPSQVTLLAGNGAIPAATDIGYQSVDGSTPASSANGFYFNPNASFEIAIDFALSFQNTPTGGLAIGFGIGEDGDGMNSAGVGLITNNGVPIGFGGAARVNDVTQPAQIILLAGSLSGSLFAAYDAATGNVTVGARTDPNAAVTTKTFTGIQNLWSDSPLLASFFLRSDNTLGSAWTSGNASAVFSNFRVITGNPVAVPEPATWFLLSFAAVPLLRRRGRWSNR